MIAKTYRWQKTAMAAALVVLGLSGTQAFALSLGRLSVQSALGEPLRAELDVPEITAEEAASLKAAVAQPDAFTAAGLEYSPALTGLQVSLQRRADGRAYLRLSSDRSVNEPFVDLILEATWASGRIVRDYTLLLDPPSLRNAPTPTLAQTPATAPSATPPAVPSPAPAPVVAPAPARAAKAAAPPARAPAAARAAAQPAAAAPSAPVPAPGTKAAADGDTRITVKTGDTASKIASVHKSAGISLDQMLVALLRANPDAFIRDNLNRVRAGAVMTIPSAASAASVEPAEASKIVVAQSKDFNEFRRNLATNAPQAAVGNADRKTSGTVGAKVDDKKPAGPAPDKLTLSKGAITSQTEQAKIAKDLEAKDAAARAAEIAKNISDLSKVAAGAAPAPAPSPAPAATPKPAVPEVPLATATPPVSPAPVTPPTPAAAPTPAPTPAPAAVPAPVPEEPSLLDSLMEDPMVPLGAAGLLALLGGYGFYRVRQRRQQGDAQDSAFLESRLQPDSFFGASGGQRVDTERNGKAGPESMQYSASQLDAADDVDPLAEADVYLAYGRDMQAEEILKEALRTNPNRLAIHSKLLEIYAKRRDARSFENTATQAHKITGGSGPDWTRICAWGLTIDPGNPLYLPGGAPPAAAAAAASAFAGSTLAQSAHAELAPQDGAGVDLDLDLDFSMDEQPAAEPEPGATNASLEDPPAPAYAQTAELAADLTDNGLDMDLDLDLDPSPAAEPNAKFAPVIEMPDISLSLDDLDLGLDETETKPASFDATPNAATSAPADTPATPAADQATDLMDFDLESLSMELDGAAEMPAEVPAEAPDNLSDDPMGTKLALAEEFISIGDEDGARALIEEVLEEATGDLLAKAQKALAQLS